MKKLIYLFLTLLIVSCSSDDSNGLIGETFKYTYTGGEYYELVAFTNESEGRIDFFTETLDSGYTFTYIFDEETNLIMTQTNEAPFRFEGDRIILLTQNEPIYYKQ